MSRIVSEWAPLKDGQYILLLDSEVPNIKFTKYRIAGKEYEPLQIHIPGEYLLKSIALKGEGGFVGKEVDFI